MSTKSSARARTAVVASTAVLTMVAATSMAGAHEGVDGENAIHACVQNTTGALRVLSSTAQNCRPSETAMHWTTDGGDNSDLDEFMLRLLAENNDSDLVHWNNLAGIPEWVVDGLPGWLQDGEVTFGEIAGNLPDNTVHGGTVVDGSLTGADLAGSYDPFVIGAVTGAKIADASVEGRDLAAGSVTPDKLSPQASSSFPSGSTTIGTGTPVPDLGVSVEAAAGSAIMVTGQVQLACTGCNSVVEYKLQRTDSGGAATVSPVYRLQLSPGHEADVASLSFMDVVGVGGAQAYQLLLSSSDAGVVGASEGILNVQVLGRP